MCHSSNLPRRVWTAPNIISGVPLYTQGIEARHLLCRAIRSKGFVSPRNECEVAHGPKVPPTDRSFPKIPSAGDLATRLSLLCGKNSLIVRENSLLACVGNLGVTSWFVVGKPSRLPAFAARFAKFPCIFPCIREFELRKSFAKDCQHSQPVAGFLALS